MKKLLLSVAVVAASLLSLDAQTTVYDFGKIYGPDLEAAIANNPAATTCPVQSKEGILVMNDNAKVVIEGNVKSSEGVIYTHRLKLGGKSILDAATGLPKYCSFGIPVSGPGTLKIVALTGSNGSDRVVDYAHIATDGTATSGTTGLVPKSIEAEKVTIDGNEYDNVLPLSWEFKGEAGTLYLYSPVNGNNFYAVMFTPAGGTSIDAVAEKVVSVEYYNLGGLKVNKPTEGVYVVKERLDNGMCKVSKKIIR